MTLLKVKNMWVQMSDRQPEKEGEYIIAWPARGGGYSMILDIFKDGRWYSDVPETRPAEYWHEIPNFPHGEVAVLR